MAESVRTFWKGHLRLALVTIPIRLVSAQKSESTVAFHQVDRQSKQRIRYQKVAPGRGEVSKEDIVMGYEVEPGNYVFFEDEELDALKLQSRHTIELSQFVDKDDISPLFFEKPYYVLPDGEVAEEGYRVIRDALEKKGKIGIGQLTLRGRENLIALYPDGPGLVVDTLRYAEEIRDADQVFSGVSSAKTRADMLEMAEELIDRRAKPFDPSQFKNHYAEALRDLIQSKLSTGQAVAVDEQEEKGAKVLDFMEALRRSVNTGDKKAATSAPADVTPAKLSDAKVKTAKSAPKPAPKAVAKSAAKSATKTSEPKKAEAKSRKRA